MELSPRQRSAVFVLVVAVLAALGYYLVAPAVTHSHGSAQAAATPASTPTPPSTAPAAAPTVSASAAAASVAVRFSVDYNTFTYTESATAYVGAMGNLITSELAGTLQAGYQIPGVAKLRKSQKQVSTGTAVISSLRAFGPASMTFIVTAGQRLATSDGISNASTQYAVTVTGSGSSWQVSDIELESAGNE